VKLQLINVEQGITKFATYLKANFCWSVCKHTIASRS